MQRLDEIQHEQSKMHSDIAVLLIEQKNIKNELTEHKAQGSSDSKSTFGKICNVVKSWVLPIVLAVFLLGRQSVEYTSNNVVYPPKSTIASQVDDTFVANHNKKIDSILIKQIMGAIKP
jgi:hypothetical protein